VSLIKKIQNLPLQKKKTYLYITLSICFVLLLTLWIALKKNYSGLQKNTSVFQVLLKGIKDFSTDYNK